MGAGTDRHGIFRPWESVLKIGNPLETKKKAGVRMEKRVIRKHQTKWKMFASYITIPIILLSVISGLFSILYFRTSRDSMIEFENTIARNVDGELKKVMDNLITSAAQYSMSPWVKRLKYMQKSPELMKKNISASDISDYASTISLSEINDSLVESIFIYYGLGKFGISSQGRVSWEGYVNLYQIECTDKTFLSGSILDQNNQKTIIHNVSFLKNGRKTEGFFLIQTIPLENYYSGEANILFFVPYEELYGYISNFLDEGTGELYLTDGEKIIYTQKKDGQILEPGESIEVYKKGSRFTYNREKGIWTSQYTKQGMPIGVLQILDRDVMYRDFRIFSEWLIMGYVLLLCLIFLVAYRLAAYSYQPLQHIMDMLDGNAGEEGNEYQVIEKALEELDSQKQKLEVTVFEQNPLIEQYILHALLNSNKAQANEVKYINIMRKYSLYRCLVLKGGAQAASYIREIDSCLAVYPQLHAAFVEEDGFFIWVISYEKESNLEEFTAFLVQAFSDSGYEETGIGLSLEQNNILHLLVAYNQAVRALEYHFFFPQKKIMRLDEDNLEERDISGEAFEIREEDRKQIEEAIEKENAEALFEHYKKILEYNFGHRMIHKEAYLSGIHKLNRMILKIFSEKKKGCMFDQTELLEPEHFLSMNGYQQALWEKIKAFMEQCRMKDSPVYFTRNQIIKKYVEAHLTDPELSLNETARMMHYTPAYFGKYFKEQFGCNFQKYVASRRIENAREYLERENGRLSVQEIALRCGFTNDVTFRRTFKMYVGITPSQYEKEHTLDWEPESR